MIPLRELRDHDLARWRELAARAAEPNPFFEPEFVLPAARHLGVRDAGLLVVRDRARDWVACMPVRPQVRRRGTRLPLLAAWRHLWYASLGTPLVASDGVADATERLVALALRSSRHAPVLPGVVLLSGVGEGVGEALGACTVAAALRGATTRGGPRLALHRARERGALRRKSLAGGTGGAGLLSPHHRRDLGRKRRRLATELDAPLVLRDEAQRAGAIEDLIALEATGWKARNGTALACLPAHAQFFRELCGGFRTAGRLQVLTYGTGERTVAATCNLLTPEGVFTFRIAHDDALARYSPGLQLVLGLVDVFDRQMSQRWLDTCAAPGQQPFEHLLPDRRAIGDYMIGAGAAGRLLELGVSAYRSIRDMSA